MRSGVVVGLTNPKVYVLWVALLPQFVIHSSTPLPLQMLQLALVPVLIAFVTDTAWALAASAARAKLVERPERLARVGKAGGVVVAALGLWLVVEGGK